MPVDLQVVLISHLVTGCITGMLALVLWWFSHESRTNAYRVWSAAWMAFALYSFAGGGALLIGVALPALEAIRPATSALSQIASTAAALLLVAGTVATTRHSDVPRRRVVIVLIVSVVLGLALTVGLALGLPTRVRLLYRSGLTATALLTSAVLLLRSAGGRTGPSRLLAIALMGLGLCYVHYLVHGLAAAAGTPLPWSLNLLPLFELPFIAAVVATKAAMALADQRSWSEATLHAQSQRHHEVLERLITGVYVVRDGTLRYTNTALARMFGYAPGVLDGTDPRDLVHPDDRERVASRLAGDRSSPGALEPVEFRGIRADGSEIHLMALDGTVEVDGATEVVGNVIDVTARKRASERDEVLSTMLDAAPTGIVVADADGQVVFVNESAARIRSTTRDAALETPLLEWFAKADRPRLEGCMRSTAETGGVVCEVDLVSAGPSLTVPVEVAAKAVRWQGRSAVLAVISDLSLRRAEEEERVMLATSIEQAGEAVMITDGAGRIRYVNPAFEETTGFLRTEVAGTLARALDPSMRDEREMAAMRATIADGGTWTGQLTNRRKDGTEFVEDATISPILDAGGETTAFVIVKRDISHEIVAREALAQAQRMESVGRLAGGVAHDFNNLLMIIQGYTDIVLTTVHEDDPVRADLGLVLDAADRAKSLTNQLLAFSRRQVLEPRTFDLREVLVDLDRMLRRLVGEHVQMSLDVAPELGLTWGDPRQFEQVIMNLVVNSRDAMPGGGAIRIAARNVDPGAGPEGAPTGDWVEVTVTDTGHGMDAETRARIFEPFFTTKPEGRGTGLGLSTVYGIVKQSGGEIRVESEVDRGTTFTILIPRSGEDTVRPAPSSSGAPATGRETVLVVEDEPGVLLLTERILRHAGYRVIPVASGGDALVLAEKEPGPIDLLLTDVIMPHMGGPELAERILASRPGIRVLFMSGYTDDALSDFTAVGGLPELLMKPFAAHELAGRVRTVLDRPAETGADRAHEGTEA